RIEEILVRRLLWLAQKFLPIDDLDDAALVGPVSEIDAIACWTRGDRTVKIRRRRACRARLLPGQAERANEHRLGRIAEVVDQRHAGRAPARRTRDEIRDAAVALPPVLVRAAQSAHDDGDSARLRRVGDVPDLLCGVPERAEQI